MSSRIACMVCQSESYCDSQTKLACWTCYMEVLSGKWADDKPTIEGWYWWRHEPNGGQIVFVNECAGGLCAEFSHDVRQLIETTNGQWSGPIPLPKEPA